jgi:hypothetical protein
MRDKTNPNKLRCTGDHKRCCVINRWNGTCVCEKCQRCHYCHYPILTDDIEEWKKVGLEHIALKNHHYDCAKESIINPLLGLVLGRMNDEREGVQE